MLREHKQVRGYVQSFIQQLLLLDYLYTYYHC